MVPFFRFLNKFYEEYFFKKVSFFFDLQLMTLYNQIYIHSFQIHAWIVFDIFLPLINFIN